MVAFNAGVSPPAVKIPIRFINFVILAAIVDQPGYADERTDSAFEVSRVLATHLTLPCGVLCAGPEPRV